MALINCSVYCCSTKKMLMPWKITTVHPPSCTFKEFFDKSLQEDCKKYNCNFSCVFVGKDKDLLDAVDSHLVMLEVVSCFGRFVKYGVETQIQVCLYILLLASY